jgi:hypothetical protein
VLIFRSCFHSAHRHIFATLRGLARRKYPRAVGRMPSAMFSSGRFSRFLLLWLLQHLWASHFLLRLKQTRCIVNIRENILKERYIKQSVRHSCGWVCPSRFLPPPPSFPLTTFTIYVWLLGTVDKKDGGFSFSILYTYMHV